MELAGWIAIALEIILLLIWINSIFFTRNGTDAAGRGIAMVFVLLLSAYIGGGVLLMLTHRAWAIVTVLIMAAIPLTIVIIGLVKHYGSSKPDY